MKNIALIGCIASYVLPTCLPDLVPEVLYQAPFNGIPQPFESGTAPALQCPSSKCPVCPPLSSALQLKTFAAIGVLHQGRPLLLLLLFPSFIRPCAKFNVPVHH